MALETDFDTWMQARSLSLACRKNYRASMHRWLEWRDPALPFATSRKEATAFMGHMLTTRVPGTVRLYMLGLRAFYDFLKDIGEVDDNPVRAVRPPRPASKPVVPLTGDDVQKMIDSCDNIRDLAILLLLLGGGLRRSEVFNITRDDADFDAGTVRVLGKGTKYRIVAPGEAAMSALKAATRHEGRLCPRRGGDFVYRRIRRIAAVAGVEGRVFVHQLRHTFAVRFCEAGGGIDLLQSILGHTSIEMSMHYSKAGRELRALQAQATFNDGSMKLSSESWSLRVDSDRGRPLKDQGRDKWTQKSAPKPEPRAPKGRPYERRAMLSARRRAS